MLITTSVTRGVLCTPLFFCLEVQLVSHGLILIISISAYSWNRKFV